MDGGGHALLIDPHGDEDLGRQRKGFAVGGRSLAAVITAEGDDLAGLDGLFLCEGGGSNGRNDAGGIEPLFIGRDGIHGLKLGLVVSVC